MPQETLSLTSLHETVSGGIGKAFDQELARVIADLHDRPQIKKSRILTLKVELAPQPMITDNVVSLDHVDAKLSVTAKFPERAAVQYAMKPVGKDSLAFSTSSPDDPNQLDMDDMRRTTVEQAKAGIVAPTSGPRLSKHG